MSTPGSHRPLLSPPSPDPITGLPTVAFTLPLTRHRGILGLQADIRHLAEQLLYHPREAGERLFLIDFQGRALVHPAQEIGKVEDVRRLEAVNGFDAVLHRVLSEPSGEARAGGVAYSWHGVEGSEWVVVVAGGRGEVSSLQPVHYTREGADFQYHDMIQGGGSKLCRHLGEVASMQSASLYLAPRAFASPYSQLIQQPVPLRTQSLIAFLTDPNRLIANPGLRAAVRPDSSVVARLAEHWRTQAETSPLNNYIVRRRAATPRGVLLSYPGTRVTTPGPRGGPHA